MKKNKANIGLGIHNFNDPKLVDDFSEAEYEIDVTQFHTYAAEWRKDNIVFLLTIKLLNDISILGKNLLASNSIVVAISTKEIVKIKIILTFEYFIAYY